MKLDERMIKLFGYEWAGKVTILIWLSIVAVTAFASPELAALIFFVPIGAIGAALAIMMFAV